MSVAAPPTNPGAPSLETPAASATSPWRQLAWTVAPWRGVLALAGALTLLGALLELAPPLIIGRVIDEHLTPGVADGLLQLAALYLVATAAVQGTGAFATYLVSIAAQGALHRLRTRLHSHLQTLPIAYFDRTPLGDLISRCTADVETLDTVFSSGAIRLVADLSRLVTVSVAMVALSPGLTLVSALVVPLIVVVTRYFQARIRAAERANRVAVGLMNIHLQETLVGVEVVRAYGREATFVRRFRFALRDVLDAFIGAVRYASLYPPTMTTTAALVIALLLWVGTSAMFGAGAWGVSLGTLTAFVLLFDRFFKPIVALGDEWQTVQSALSGAERICQVLAVPSDLRVSEPAGGGIAAGARTNGHATRGDADEPSGPAAELRHVTFGYEAGRPILHDVTIAVGAGQHVAVVGRTGAGKSSVLSLLGGLYAPWSGTVRVAGRDPRSLTPEERRHVVGVVPQAVHLFGGTVRENLTLFDPDADQAAVERAARIAGADDFVRALPRGYETPLAGAGRGDGVQLSAGQRQLLALARALVADPALLLLDEATAAVDGASDAAFRAALRTVTGQRGRAALTVAHRLSTAREADVVVVLEDGRVVEVGPPLELERRGGRFAALAELEAAGWSWEDLPSEAPAPATGRA